MEEHTTFPEGDPGDVVEAILTSIVLVETAPDEGVNETEEPNVPVPFSLTS